MDRDSGQESLSEFTDPSSGSTSDNAESSHPDPPSGDHPSDLYDWLTASDSPPVEAATSELPALIDAPEDPNEMWYAGECIELILEGTDPPVDCSELVYALDQQHIPTDKAIRHLLSLYPLDIPQLKEPIDVEAINQLPLSERMVGYQLLSRLPPDETIYQTLSKVVNMFDGSTKIEHTVNLQGYFQLYAVRCLQAYLRYPDNAPRSLALQAIRDHRAAVLRVIAANPEAAVDADIIQPLSEQIEQGGFPSQVHDGRLIATFVDAYLDTSQAEAQTQIATLTQTVLKARIQPTAWKATLAKLTSQIETGDAPPQIGQLLATLLTQVAQIGGSADALEEVGIADRLINADDAPVQCRVQAVREIAKHWPGLLHDEVAWLVEVAQNTDGATRSLACKALADIGKEYHSDVLAAIEPLVQAVPGVRSAKEVDDVGRILRSLSVYPPPPQLRELYGSTNSEIDSTAKDLMRDLRSEFSDGQPLVEPGEVADLEALATEYAVVRRTGAVTWQSPSLSSVEVQVISQIAQIILKTSGEKEADLDEVESLIASLTDVSTDDFDGEVASIQLVPPSHDPGWVLLVLIGAVFALLIDPSVRVAVYSPATNGWGTKRDVKTALNEFGLVPKQEASTSVTPLLDLVPTSRVADQGLIVEDSSTTIPQTPPSITLVRDPKALTQVSTDVLIHNHLPGINAEDAKRLHSSHTGVEQESRPTEVSDQTDRFQSAGGIAEQASLHQLSKLADAEPVSNEGSGSPARVHIEIHGLFSAQQGDDRRQYVGPPVDLSAPWVITDGEPDRQPEAGSTVWPRSTARTWAASTLTRGRSHVEVRAVETEAEIGDLLGKLDQYAEAIDDPKASRDAQVLRYTLSGLPVPADLHDRWIKQQLDQGNTWVPRQIEDRKRGLEELAQETPLDAEILADASRTAETLIDRLEDQNPLFEELLDVLDRAAHEDKQVGVLCSKKTYKEMLRLYLKDRASDWVVGDNLHLLDEDTVRGITRDEVEWLVTFDVLAPQTAIYYHHPAPEKVVVLGHANDSLLPRLYGIEQKRRPFLPETADKKLPELEVTVEGSEINVEESEESLTDDLFRTYLSLAAQSRSAGGSGGSGSGSGISRYHVELEGGDSVSLWDAHPVIVQSDEHLVSTGEYVLRSLSRVSQGDKIVLIDEATLADLWEAFLRDEWDSRSNEEPADAVMDAVELWYDAVQSGLDAHVGSEGNLLEGVSGFADEIAPDTSVDEGTVRDWARSVIKADSPLDLVFRKQLRIGPQQPPGVEAVARAYGAERMAANWREVFDRIVTIRTTLRNRGGLFWERLAEQACEGDLLDEPGVREVTVSRCRKAD